MFLQSFLRYLVVFLQDFGEIEVECIGVQYNKGEGKGVEIFVDYKRKGNYKFLERLVLIIKGRELIFGFNILEVKKCI